ncbi:hypothetical protein CsatA_012897 [Cannabis sativa]
MDVKELTISHVKSHLQSTLSSICLCTRLPLLKRLQVFRFVISYVGIFLQCIFNMAYSF